MPKLSSILCFSTLTFLLILNAFPSPADALPGTFGVETPNQSTVLKIKKDKDQEKKKDKEKKAFSCKKAKCDPGEVKLDKPNIYGACCQVGSAPLKPKPAPDLQEVCGVIVQPDSSSALNLFKSNANCSGNAECSAPLDLPGISAVARHESIKGLKRGRA
jgi:hypothetical protein